VELERLEVTEARKTLGVKTAPTGENTAHFEHMLEASHKWAAQIKESNMRQMDAWLALRSTIGKTLEYPLTCTTLTEKQCEQIMRPAMSAGLAKSHICRSFPTSFLHAGAEALGSGMPHLFTVQDIAVGSRTRNHAKAEPGLVKKIADPAIFNQSSGKSVSFSHVDCVGQTKHSKIRSLRHLTSKG
jgi:hypothetical protein